MAGVNIITKYIPIHRMYTEITTDAIIQCMAPYKEMAITGTLNNGKVFAYHPQVAKKSESDITFAQP